MTLNEDIIFIGNRWGLVHYIIYRCSCANLQVDEVTLQTTEATDKQARHFIEQCLEVWNESHDEQLDSITVCEMVIDMQGRDVQDYRRMMVIDP